MKKLSPGFASHGLELVILFLFLAGSVIYMYHWRGSLDIRPARLDPPAAVTVIDARNVALEVPAPFELTGYSAEAAGPDDSYLHIEEHIFADRDQARREMDAAIEHLRTYLPSLGHGWVEIFPLDLDPRRERLYVLAMEFSHFSHDDDSKFLEMSLYVLRDRGFMKIRHNNFGRVDVTGSDSEREAASLAQRERFMGLAGAFLRKLGRGDFQGPDAGLKALNRLSRRDDSPFEVYLTSARFRLPGESGDVPRYPAMSPGFEVREAIDFFRPPRRNYLAELFTPGFGEGARREKRRPLELGGRAGEEAVIQHVPYFGPDSLLLVWDQDPLPNKHTRFWQLYLLTGGIVESRENLARWQMILETVRFPDPLPWR